MGLTEIISLAGYAIEAAGVLVVEFLIAGDIIRTVIVETSLENVAVLGLIILIRTFLSLTLHLEIEGRWPWQPEDKGSAQ